MRPVNRLPPEVIALSATFVSLTDPRPVVSLTHVCRYWRKAIASSPRNWASISSEWKQLVPLCLERVGVVPLTVDITVPDISGDDIFLQALLPHASKISQLSLTRYSSIETVVDTLPGFFTSPMPDLTSLKLEQTGRPTESFPSDETPPPPLFQYASKLKSLHLTRTPLYPSLISISSLVDLKLVGYTTPFQFRKFIEFLRTNRDLELIVLDIQFAEVPRKPSARTVSLPRLRQLSFACVQAPDAQRLIKSISFPRDILLEVSASRENEDFDLYMSQLSLALPKELFTPITTIKNQNEPGVIQIYGGGSCFTFRCSRSLLDACSGFSLFPTTAVREFHVGTSSCNTLPTALSQLSGLETLVLVGVASFPYNLLDFLAQEPVLCPSLKTLAFFDCNLDWRVVEHLERVVAKRKESTAAWLYRIVIVRNRTGPLPDQGFIHRLRGSVPRVDARIDDKLPDLS